MQDIALTLFGCLIGLMGIILVGGMPFHYRSEMRKARVRAENKFRSYRASNPDGSLLFDGKTCLILDASDSYTPRNGRIHDYVMTFFALTPAGQHFLFKSNETGMPYVSALSAERAELILKDKYREAVTQ